MQHQYPYKSQLKASLSKLKEGRDYFLWHEADAKALVTKADGPIVEIGGPSDLGYFFLDGVDLKSKPIITNITKSPMPLAENSVELANQVQEIVDGRDMSYKDSSVGIFLMSYISVSSDWWVSLDETEKEKAADQFNAETDVAMLEMGQVAVGVLELDKVEHAQRVQIFREVKRSLKPGGLLLSDGAVEDMVILQRLGFKLAALLQIRDLDPAARYRLSYEFVAIKT